MMGLNKESMDWVVTRIENALDALNDYPVLNIVGYHPSTHNTIIENMVNIMIIHERNEAIDLKAAQLVETMCDLFIYHAIGHDNNDEDAFAKANEAHWKLCNWNSL